MGDVPVLSVVTSCRNGGRHVEATVRSVVAQDYPRLEYIFVDGASTDDTLAIARRYADRIAVLISEPDAGQYDGIRKGFGVSTGEIMAWLNADDVYFPWTLSVVGEIFGQFPDVDWIIGTPGYMNSRGQCTRVSGNAGAAYPREYIRNGWFRPALAGYLQQESMFWRRRLWDRAGGLNLDLGYAADFDLWRRFAEHAELHSVTAPLALFRQRPGEQRSSAGSVSYEAEVRKLCERLKPPPRYWEVTAGQGEPWAHACRLLIWRKCSLVTWSPSRKEWIKIESRRPLARTSFAEALLGYRMRRVPEGNP
jgi:glycosyltransferase involved in cell wall biosynthesis